MRAKRVRMMYGTPIPCRRLGKPFRSLVLARLYRLSKSLMTVSSMLSSRLFQYVRVARCGFWVVRGSSVSVLSSPALWRVLFYSFDLTFTHSSVSPSTVLSHCSTRPASSTSHDDMKKGQADDTLEHSLFAAANT